jgi:hypothetical protein
VLEVPEGATDYYIEEINYDGPYFITTPEDQTVVAGDSFIY